MDLKLDFTDKQKTGLIAAVDRVNMQVRQQNLQIESFNMNLPEGETAKPLLPLKTVSSMLTEMVTSIANQEYQQVYQQKGQRALQAFDKLPDQQQTQMLGMLGVADMVDLSRWDEIQ